MKRIISTLLAATLIVTAFTACTSKTVEEPATDPAGEQVEPAESTGDPAKLVIAARGGLHVEAIDAVKAEFEAANNCTIEILGLEADELKQKISLDSVNDKGAYDLAMADDPWMPELCEAGVYANLTELGLTDDPDFIPASVAIGKHPYETGDTFALPFAGNVQLFFYNKDLLAANGSEIPTSWEEVLEISAAINGTDGKYGYVIRGQQGNPIVSDYLPLLWAYGGNVFDAEWNITLDSEEAVKALEMYIELQENGVNYEKNDLVAAVSDGNAAMALGWPSWFISGEGASAAYAAIPNKAAASATEQKTGMIGHWMMGVTSNSQNKELALSFLEFITSSDTQKKMADHGGVPTRTSVYSDAELSAKYGYYPTLLDATVNSVVRPRTPLWSEIETVYGAELSSAVSGQKSADQALTDAKVAVEKIMK